MTVAAFKIKHHFLIKLYGLTLCSSWTRKHRFKRLMFSLSFLLSWLLLLLSHLGSFDDDLSLCFSFSLLPCFPSPVHLFHSLPLPDFLPQPRMLLQCLEAAAEGKSCSYPAYFFLAMLAWFILPDWAAFPQKPSWCSAIASATTASPFHFSSRSTFQLHSYSGIGFLMFWAAWGKQW